MITTIPFQTLLEEAPYLHDFLVAHSLPEPQPHETPEVFFRNLPHDELAELGTDHDALLGEFQEFSSRILQMFQTNTRVQSLDIIGGRTKSGESEGVSLTLHPGDILSIVGPTGAGKSRLLEDIECMAQGDTPTKRKILINGAPPSDDERFNVDSRLVAQLSQNMNFVMDLCVSDFLLMHAESRMVEQPQQVVREIFETAIQLAGEPFEPQTSVTALSGGQSRALMIADTARLSRSPIVLIDEIENAGVDRNLALDLLIRQEKIVVLVTHDPELALAAPKRLVIRNGGMHTLVFRTEEEERTRRHLQNYSKMLAKARKAMRNGEELAWQGIASPHQGE